MPCNDFFEGQGSPETIAVGKLAPTEIPGLYNQGNVYNELVVDSSSVGISTGMTYVNKDKKVRKRNKNNVRETRVSKEKNKKKNVEKRNKNEVYNREVAERSVENKPVYFDVEEKREKVESLKSNVTEENLNDTEAKEKYSNEESIPGSFEVEREKKVVLGECLQDEIIESSCVERRSSNDRCTESLINKSNEFEDKKFKKQKQVRFLEELTNSENNKSCPKVNTNGNGNVARRALVSRSKEETKKVIRTPNAEPDKSLEQSKAKCRVVRQDKIVSCEDKVLNCEKEVASCSKFLSCEEKAISNWKKEYPSGDGRVIKRNNLDIGEHSEVKLIGNLVDTGWKESRRVFLEVFIRDQPLRCGVDSMADVSLISRRTWNYLRKPQLKQSKLRLEDAQGNSFNALGEVQLNMCIKTGDFNFMLTKFKFIVVPDLIVNCILGRDWMEFFEVTTKFGESKSTIIVGTKEIELIDEDHTQSHPVILSDDIRLESNTRTLVAVQVVGSKEGIEGIVDQIQETPEGIMLDPCINKIEDKHVVLGIWNTRDKEVLIPKGTIIGSWCNINVGIYNIIVYKPGIFISIKNRVTSKSSIVRGHSLTNIQLCVLRGSVVRIYVI